MNEKRGFSKPVGCGFELSQRSLDAPVGSQKFGWVILARFDLLTAHVAVRPDTAFHLVNVDLHFGLAKDGRGLSVCAAPTAGFRSTIGKAAAVSYSLTSLR